MQAGLFTGRRLVAHIDLRGGVFSHEYDGQARLQALSTQCLHTFGHFGAHGGGQRLAVDDSCGHAIPSGLVRAIFIRSATVVTSSFSMMLARCASTVLMLMFRSPAICLFR